MCCLNVHSNSWRGRGVGCNRVPCQHVIEVVLHVESIVLYNETQCYDAPSDHTPIIHMLLRNTLDEVREKHIVRIPEIDEKVPFYFPISVCFNPLILRVTLPAELPVDRAQHETDMVVCR